MTVVIVRAEMTCLACPSQWDAWDSEGRYWYLRYRSGHGAVSQYPQGPGWYEEDVLEDPAEVLEFEFGAHLDGFIELEEFARRAGLELDLPAEYAGQHAGDGQRVTEAAANVMAWLEPLRTAREGGSVNSERDLTEYLTSLADEALQYDVPATVCVTHLRFVPCRRGRTHGSCVTSEDPKDVERVAAFHSRRDPESRDDARPEGDAGEEGGR